MSGGGGPTCVIQQAGNTILSWIMDPTCPTLLPYYDPILELISVDHPPLPNCGYQTCFDVANAQLVDDTALTAWTICGINKNNPDWDRLYDITTASPFLLGGGGNHNQPGIAVLLIDTVLGDGLLDVWWQQSSYKKYGEIAFGSAYSETPVRWINLMPCTIRCDRDATYNGFQYSMSTIVTAVATSYSRITVPTRTIFGTQFPNPGGGLRPYTLADAGQYFSSN